MAKNNLHYKNDSKKETLENKRESTAIWWNIWSQPGKNLRLYVIRLTKIFLLAFIVAFMTTPYTIKIANKIGAVDIPKDKRRMHTKKMPKFGGPAVILGFLISMIYLIIVMSIEGSLDLFTELEYGKKLLGVLL